MAWKPWRAEQGADEPVPVVGYRPHELPVRIGIGAQGLSRLFHRAFEDSGGAVVEGMGERGRRVDPLEAVLLQRQDPEEW
jgi:hypothetical protein